MLVVITGYNWQKLAFCGGMRRKIDGSILILMIPNQLTVISRKISGNRESKYDFEELFDHLRKLIWNLFELK